MLTTAKRRLPEALKPVRRCCARLEQRSPLPARGGGGPAPESGARTRSRLACTAPTAEAYGHTRASGWCWPRAEAADPSRLRQRERLGARLRRATARRPGTGAAHDRGDRAPTRPACCGCLRPTARGHVREGGGRTGGGVYSDADWFRICAEHLGVHARQIESATWRPGRLRSRAFERLRSRGFADRAEDPRRAWPGPMVSLPCTGTTVARPSGMLQEVMAALGLRATTRPRRAERGDELLAREAGGSRHSGDPDALYADRTRGVVTGAHPRPRGRERSPPGCAASNLSSDRLPACLWHPRRAGTRSFPTYQPAESRSVTTSEFPAARLSLAQWTLLVSPKSTADSRTGRRRPSAFCCPERACRSTISAPSVELLGHDPARARRAATRASSRCARWRSVHEGTRGPTLARSAAGARASTSPGSTARTGCSGCALHLPLALAFLHGPEPAALDALHVDRAALVSPRARACASSADAARAARSRAHRAGDRHAPPQLRRRRSYELVSPFHVFVESLAARVPGRRTCSSPGPRQRRPFLLWLYLRERRAGSDPLAHAWARSPASPRSSWRTLHYTIDVLGRLGRDVGIYALRERRAGA